MAIGHGKCEGGLRERHKRRTREALSDAAMRLLATEGIEAITAERLADEAGVSRRTVFNYFPHVESVLTASIETVILDRVEAFVARPADEPLRESMRVVVSGLLDDPVFEQARALERAASTSPPTRRFLREFHDTVCQAFEEALQRRIGPDADEVYVAAFGAATAALFSRVTRLTVALDQEERLGRDSQAAAARHRERLMRGMDMLFAGFDESAANSPSRPKQRGSGSNHPHDPGKA